MSFSIEVNRNEGYSKATNFKFSTVYTPLSDLKFIKWSFGDGSVLYNTTDVSHNYAIPGEYRVTVFANTLTQFLSAEKTIKVINFLKNSIYFDYLPPPTFAGHFNQHPFRINITSSSSNDNYIDLYAQFSRSYVYQEPQNKWSFLKPQWRFLDLDGNPITSIKTTDTEIQINDDGQFIKDGTGTTVGVSGFAEFYFVDDIYNYDLLLNDNMYTILFATLQTSGVRVSLDSFNADLTLPGFSNSTAIAYTPHMFLRRSPEKLSITENGLREYSNPRWTETEHPIIIKAAFNDEYPMEWEDGIGIQQYDKEANFARYIPIETTLEVPITAGVLNMDTAFSPEPKFRWIDDTLYKVAGYHKGYFTTTTPFAFNTYITAAANIFTPPTSGNYYNPYLWISNPAAGTMTAAQYYKIHNTQYAQITTSNLNIAHVKTWEMPIIDSVDFSMDSMAVSGFHGIYSIAALPMPTYHAWASDSELDTIYRLNTKGDVLKTIDLKQLVDDEKLGYRINKKISPAHITLDGEKNLWVSLYDTISVMKFDSNGNFMFATTPLTALAGYVSLDISESNLIEWFNQQMNVDENYSLNYDYKTVIEPTGIETDLENNVWVSYSNQFKGFFVKYNKCGDFLNAFSAPLCSTPQELLCDKNGDLWICYNSITWNAPGKIEKRTTNGVLLSSFDSIRNPNYITLDASQNLWYTFGFNEIAVINNQTATTLTYLVSGKDLLPTDYPKVNVSFSPIKPSNIPWFDVTKNADETLFEGMASDVRGYIYLLNSIENQVYVFDTKTKKVLDTFYINPQGFVYYLSDQNQYTKMDYSLWNKSIQAHGDWTGFRWINKYANQYLPDYSESSFFDYVTGSSDLINFYDRSVYTAFKKNEDFNLSRKMQELAFMPSLQNSPFLFENFLGAIFGKEPFYQDDLGVTVYEKIANFLDNNINIDTCEIPQLYNISDMVDYNSDDFLLNYPPTIRRIMNLASVNLSKLIGVKCNCGLNFERPNDCAKVAICSYCKKEKQNNRGNLIESLTYEVSAGQPVVLKTKSLDSYRLVPVGILNGQTTYTINDLATSLGFESNNWPLFYEFYEYINEWNGGIIENLIDWNSNQTTISRELSTSNDWFKEEGLLDMFFNYELYKGLDLFKD
jgi:streptogramin lyase